MLTEEEVRKLDEDPSTSSPSSHPTTTAAEGASMDEVEAGVLAARAIDSTYRKSTSRTTSTDGRSSAEVGQGGKERKKAGMAS